MGRVPERRITWSAPLAIVLMAPNLAQAFELSSGLSVGGFQAGTVPRLALSPHAGIAWSKSSNFLVALNDVCSVLPPKNYIEIGIYNEISVSIGYASEASNFIAGPSLALYSMTTCGLQLCGRVDGVAIGGHAQTDVYFAGPLGVSVSANVNWIGGRSQVLPGGLAMMVVAGPVLRWRSR